MRKSIGLWLLICCVLSMSLGSLQAAEGNYITTDQFAMQLNQLGKVGSKPVVGSNEVLTREKAANMLIQYLNYPAISKKIGTKSSFTDVTTSKGDIELISRLGIMSGVGNGLFSPKSTVSESSSGAIIEKIKGKLQENAIWKHACYAISSSNQMDWLKDYNAVSFGWAEVQEANGSFNVTTLGNSFKVPNAFQTPLDLAKANNVETYLMIYFDGTGSKAQSLLNNPDQRSKVITQIVTLANGLTKDNETRSFDGVTIDFEGLVGSELKAPYVSFLNELSLALKVCNKKMNVAVQPTLYYKGYDYKEIGNLADHVILMAHDYGTKSLSLNEQQTGMTTTPLTPIDSVYLALIDAKEAIEDTHKIALQFSFASLQWQKQNGTVLNSKAYTPSYDKIEARIQMPETVTKFNEYAQSSYATYEENGITNVIWYEDEKSIQAKMDLAKLLGINSFSYWRLGNIPNEIRGLR